MKKCAMTTIRNAELYIPRDLIAQLRFIADVLGRDSVDEYAAEVLSAHVAKDFPGVAGEIELANAARKKVLREALERLRSAGRCSSTQPNQNQEGAMQ